MGGWRSFGIRIGCRGLDATLAGKTYERELRLYHIEWNGTNWASADMVIGDWNLDVLLPKGTCECARETSPDLTYVYV